MKSYVTRSWLTRAIAGAVLLGLTSSAWAVQIYGLTDENDLLVFDSNSPEDLISGGVITGLGVQDLIGIDIRPANNMLYGVGNLGGIFTINPVTRAATLVSTLSSPLVGSRFGVDFNPVADRLRLTSDLDQNLRVNVDTGATIVDGTLKYLSTPGNDAAGATGDNPNVTASAYTNSFGPSPRNGPSQPVGPGTTLYNIDVRGSEDRLVTQNPPNNGELQVVGPLGINALSLLGFDIFHDGTQNLGLAALITPANVSQLYTINLTTGAATLVGDIGGGDLLDGLTVGIAAVPEPASWVLMGLGGVALAVLRKCRR